MDGPLLRKQILLVDDSADLRAAVVATLASANYQVLEAESARAALNLLERSTPDLILSDVNMPVMNGIEFYTTLRQNPRWVLIPFILLTANDSPAHISQGRALGVEDYLTKPVDSAELLSIVNARLLRVADVQIAQIGRAYLETVNVLANTIEGRDAYTHGHVERVAAYAHALAAALGWAPEHLRTLEFGARLHDIGKIVVPDSILNKPAPLSPSEWEAMKQHPAAGASILREISHLQVSVPYVLHHHERWDGSGYPQGLRGKAIPVEGRLLAIVDVYDALTTERPYHPARTYHEVGQYLSMNAGRLFDPHMVEVFLDAIHRLIARPPLSSPRV